MTTAAEMSHARVVTLETFHPYKINSGILLKVLDTRLAGLSEDNRAALYKVLGECQDTKELIAQTPTTKSMHTFANDDLELIYKIQLWDRMGYGDDVLRDMLQQQPPMNLHLCVYSHLFQFTPQDVTFLQEEKAIHELARAAIWVSEILRSLSLYTTCLPVYLIPLLLGAYPHQRALKSIAPGIFVFDMLFLFPELFPFCTLHPKTCKNFCLNYNLSLVGKNRLLKLVGGVLTLTTLRRVQLQVLYEHASKLDPTAPSPFSEFLIKAKFLIQPFGDDWYSLNVLRIREYSRQNKAPNRSGSASSSARQLMDTNFVSNGTEPTSPRSPSGGRLSYESLVGASGDHADDLLEQPEMIVKIAREVFKNNGGSSMDFSTLVVQINDRYVVASEQCVSKMDILNSLKGSRHFSFNSGNTEVYFTS